jgi:hypothetical protein
VRLTWRVVPACLGWLVLALVLDVILGLGLEAIHPADEVSAPGVVPAPVIDPTDPTDRSPDQAPLSRRCLGHDQIREAYRAAASSPAYAGAPWAREYWCEFGRVEGEYVPFLYNRSTDTHQAMINIEDGIRRSYRAAGTDQDTPVVWFFGGSTMLGWGQRDQHTIPSEVVRVSEAAGAPVRAVNFGVLSWVHFQEVLAFEQNLAHRPAPDLVVFYDGVNETNVQSGDIIEDSRPSDDPTIYDFGQDPPPAAPPVLGSTSTVPDQGPRSLLDRWADASAVAALARGLSGVLGLDPAAAADEDISDATVIRRTLAVYERGRAIATDLAERYGVEAHFYWQPRVQNLGDEAYQRTDQPLVGRQTRTRELAILDRLTAPTVDLSHAFDGVDPHTLFADDAHTNEQGSRLAAEAIWADLAPPVRRMYAQSEVGG